MKQFISKKTAHMIVLNDDDAAVEKYRKNTEYAEIFYSTTGDMYGC